MPFSNPTHITLELVNLEVKVLRTELKSLADDVQELKETNKELLEFMYKFEGGKASLFALLTVSAAVGAIISSIVGFLTTFFVGHK
jgi:hypothetical protein